MTMAIQAIRCMIIFVGFSIVLVGSANAQVDVDRCPDWAIKRLGETNTAAENRTITVDQYREELAVIVQVCNEDSQSIYPGWAQQKLLELGEHYAFGLFSDIRLMAEVSKLPQACKQRSPRIDNRQ